MDRNEILEKSRRSRQDEGVTHAQDLGRIFAKLSLYIVYLLLLVFNLIFGGEHRRVVSATMATLFCAYFSAEHFMTWIFTFRKLDLIVSVLGTVCFIVGAVMFVILLLR